MEVQSIILMAGSLWLPINIANDQIHSKRIQNDAFEQGSSNQKSVLHIPQRGI